MLRHCRATAERIRQRKEREQVLVLAPDNDKQRLTKLFTLWDSLPYVDEELPIMPMVMNDEPRSLVLPRVEMTGKVKVAHWLSKLPLPTRKLSLSDTISTLSTIVEEDTVTDKAPKKSTIRKLLARVRGLIRRSLAKQ